MQRLYIISLVLHDLNAPAGSITTKQTLSYRQSENGDEALGTVIRITMAAYPNYAVQSYVISEIPPEHVMVIFKAQEGHWELPVSDVQPTGENNEPDPTPSSV